MHQVASDDAASSISSAAFKQGMRRLASGVVLIATECEGERFGLAATAVIPISAEPPVLMVCINRSASAHDALSRSGCFSVNLLRGEDREIADLFSSSKDRARRFSGREWAPLATGAPVLLGSLASFDCRVVQALPSSSHTLFFGEVVELKMFSDEIRPLLYCNGNYHTNAIIENCT